MKIKKGFVKRKIGSRFVVVTTGALSKVNNIIIEMNDTSNDIWDLIEQNKSIDEIAQELVKKYGIPFEKAKDDVTVLIEKMKEAGVLEEE
jgi:hypothetical protein